MLNILWILKQVQDDTSSSKINKNSIKTHGKIKTLDFK